MKTMLNLYCNYLNKGNIDGFKERLFMNFRKYIYILAVFSFIFCRVQVLHGQNILVKAKIDTAAIEIGDQVWLNLSIEQGNQDKVSFPSIKDTIIKGIDVLEISPTDTQYINNSRIILNKKYLISAYDFGSYVIPAFPFKNKADTLYSNALNLIVNPVKLDSTEKALIDTTQAFPVFDIKGTIDTPWTIKEFFQLYRWYIIGFFALAALIVLVVIYLKRRAKNQPLIKIPEKPKEPAHTIAFRALNALKEKKLWQKGFEKEYYLELSDILRTYIENRFQIPSFERTSHELVEIIKFQRILNNELIGELNQLLTLSDLAKFAKYKPLPNENDMCLKNSYHFVEQTLQEEKNPEENKSESDDTTTTDIQDKV